MALFYFLYTGVYARCLDREPLWGDHGWFWLRRPERDEERERREKKERLREREQEVVALEPSCARGKRSKSPARTLAHFVG